MSINIYLTDNRMGFNSYTSKQFTKLDNYTQMSRPDWCHHSRPHQVDSSETDTNPA